MGRTQFKLDDIVGDGMPDHAVNHAGTKLVAATGRVRFRWPSRPDHRAPRGQPNSAQTAASQQLALQLQLHCRHRRPDGTIRTHDGQAFCSLVNGRQHSPPVLPPPLLSQPHRHSGYLCACSLEAEAPTVRMLLRRPPGMGAGCGDAAQGAEFWDRAVAYLARGGNRRRASLIDGHAPHRDGRARASRMTSVAATHPVRR